MNIDGQSVVWLVTIGGAVYLVAVLLGWATYRWATRARRPGTGAFGGVDGLAARANARGFKADLSSVVLGWMMRDLWGSRLFLHAWAVAHYAVTTAEMESMVVHVALHRRHSHDFLATLLEQCHVDTSQLVADLLVEPDVRLRAVALAVLSRGPRVSSGFRTVLGNFFAVTEGTDRTRVLEALLCTYEEVPPATLLQAAGEHSSPTIRAVMARELRRWPSPTTEAWLDRLLCDPNWWVRREAAESLTSMGEWGIVVLRRVLSGKDRYAADMARQVLNLHRERPIFVPVPGDQLKHVVP